MMILPPLPNSCVHCVGISPHIQLLLSRETLFGVVYKEPPYLEEAIQCPLSSTCRHCEREEWEALQHEYGAKEAWHIAVKLERDHLTL